MSGAPIIVADEASVTAWRDADYEPWGFEQLARERAVWLTKGYRLPTVGLDDLWPGPRRRNAFDLAREAFQMLADTVREWADWARRHDSVDRHFPQHGDRAQRIRKANAGQGRAGHGDPLDSDHLGRLLLELGIDVGHGPFKPFDAGLFIHCNLPGAVWAEPCGESRRRATLPFTPPSPGGAA